MTANSVNQMLKQYRKYLGRCAYLEELIPKLKTEIAEMYSKIVEDVVSIGGQQMDGMPHSPTVGRPTESLGIAIADGYRPDALVAKEKELADAQREYNEKLTTVVFVGAWLKGLTEREHWIIESQVIDGVSWRELVCEYHVKYGENRTKRSLQILRDKAMEKIYAMAI